MYCIFIICSSVIGYLGWFHVLAIVLSAAMNNGVYKFFCMSKQYSLKCISWFLLFVEYFKRIYLISKHIQQINIFSSFFFGHAQWWSGFTPGSTLRVQYENRELNLGWPHARRVLYQLVLSLQSLITPLKMYFLSTCGKKTSSN